MDTNNGLPIDSLGMELQHAPRASMKSPFLLQTAVKRGMDVGLSLFALAAASPVLLAIMLAIKANDPQGSVFFRQTRIGRDGKLFKVIKFRSMRHDAEQYLRNNEWLYRKYVANNYKLDPSEDPRITPVGRFLRKTSLDELPQLVNVLRGEMSLVGPRPIVREELLEYGERSLDLLSVKPGITGYWQINGRSSVGYPERMHLELHYVYNQTISLDLWILLKTFWIVILRRGAY